MAKEIAKPTPYMSMGSDLLNLLVGGAKGVMGLPYGSILNVAGDKSSGKAQPLYSKVLTPTGWKTMGDMKVGTEVCTPYRGETAKVLAVYPQGKRDTYRFHFNDGTTVDSADNHYWVMQSPNQYSSAHKSALGHGKANFLVTTSELARLYSGTGPGPENMVALPSIDPVEYACHEKVSIAPYPMGCRLAEGPDAEKRIPDPYLKAPASDRIALLHGILDHGGNDQGDGTCIYTAQTPAFALDIAELARSLGVTATIRFSGEMAIVVLACGNTIAPFSLNGPYQTWANYPAEKKYSQQRRVLQSVEYLGKIECQCIYLDHPMHLYITDNFVPTHNTFVKNEILAANYHANNGDAKKFAWFSDDCESGDTFSTEYLYGVDLRPKDAEGYLRIGKKKVEDSTTVEDMDAHVSLFLEYLNTLPDDAVGIYAVDSLDGLSDAVRESMEGARLGQLKTGNEVKDKGDFGMQIPKFLSQQFFRPKHKKLEDAKCSLIIISQIRDKIDATGYGQKFEISCGKALEFYAHTRLFLQTVRKIERDGLVVGAYVKATTLKSKTPRPFRTAYYTVYFDYGVDNIGSNLDYLFDLREKDGKLNGNASAIKWEAGAELSLQAMKDWMNEMGYTAECRAARVERENNKNISMDFAKGWIAEDPERLAKFEERFGKQYTRDELIKMCDESPDMAAELTRRVIEKWEAHEDAVATQRPRRYGAPAMPAPAMPAPATPQPAPAAEPIAEPEPEPELAEPAAMAEDPDSPE